MSRRLCVAFIITGLDTGGGEMMLEKLLAHLPASIHPCVFSLTTAGDIGPRLRARGVQVEALGMRRGLPSPLAWLRLVRRLRALRPDVVHTWMYHADLLGGIAARAAGVHAVLWGLRQSNLDPALNRRSTLAVVQLCAWLSGLVPVRIACAGVSARDAHVRAGYAADRMVVIPNGFELDRFRPDAAARAAVRDELGVPADAPLIGVVGRFHPAKNHRGFIEALPALRARWSGLYAVLVGEGVDASNSDLAGWMARAGVADRCLLLGRRDDVPRLMAALDVLALPSLGEAFPNVVGEAMACAVPCVVSDVGDAAEIVGDTGRVVAPGDANALASALAGLLEMPVIDRAALGARAQQRIRARFDIHRVAAIHEEEYRRIAGP